ncbi:MAG: molybdopterin-dependent oxidoreductase [Burkholderiaceae bacterium]|nr:molybdopterin-dependent oxidoreductase [Burkholderiaceae bacterium]
MLEKSLKNSRRGFLISAVVTAGGVMFTVSGCKPNRANYTRHHIIPEGSVPQEMNAWITIRPDNKFVFKIPRVEIGQGSLTTISQFLAEELDVSWEDVLPEFYDPGYDLGNKNLYFRSASSPSFSILRLMKPARRAAAQIRSMLVHAAASRWGEAPETISTELGYLMHESTARALPYADLAVDVTKIPVPDPETVELRSPEDWRYIGKSVARTDIASKVDGSAVYGIDLFFAGMKYAAIKQSPVLGGRLKSFDVAAARMHAGVVDVIRINAGPIGTNNSVSAEGNDRDMDDAVAVIADDWWTASTVLKNLDIDWEEGCNAEANSDDISDDFRRILANPGPEMKVRRNEGNVDSTFANAAKIFEATYSVPFTEAAALEPISCTAVFRDEGVEVWAAAQDPDEALQIAARNADVPIERARLHLVFGGGSFGRKATSDYVAQAVQIAKAVKGTPIKLVWTREESFRRSYYAPAVLSKFRAGIDHRGELTAWESLSVSGRTLDQSKRRLSTVLSAVAV